jgi:RhtB (resistance to homoserine/threonine) family protein
VGRSQKSYELHSQLLCFVAYFNSMEYLPLIGTALLVHLLAVASPGPDFIVAVKNSLTYSRKTGLYTAVGFGLGIGVHTLYCMAGIALVISKSILLFSLIKYIGAGYLIYIGYKSFKARMSPVSIGNSEQKPDISALAAVRIGFLTNVLNPKATLFFLSLFTLVISPTTPVVIVGAISMLMVINTIVWFSLVAVFFTNSRIRSGFDSYQSIFNKVFGSLLIVLGLKVALSSQ